MTYRIKSLTVYNFDFVQPVSSFFHRSSFSISPAHSLNILSTPFLKRKINQCCNSQTLPDSCTRQIFGSLSFLFSCFLFHYPVLIFAFPTDQQLLLTGIVVYSAFVIRAVTQQRQLKLYPDIQLYTSASMYFPSSS